MEPRPIWRRLLILLAVAALGIAIDRGGPLHAAEIAAVYEPASGQRPPIVPVPARLPAVGRILWPAHDGDLFVVTLPDRPQDVVTMTDVRARYVDPVIAALGLPAWVTFGSVAAERYDRGAFETLPARTPRAWAAALRALVREPWRSAQAFEALPDGVPTAARAAASLENVYDDVLASARAAARDSA